MNDKTLDPEPIVDLFKANKIATLDELKVTGQ
jgi:hypothetical protein